MGICILEQAWYVYSLLTKIEIYVYMKCVTCHYNTKINNDMNEVMGLYDMNEVMGIYDMN